MIKYYYHLLAAILVGACAINPISACIGLSFILAAKLAETYFTATITDQDRTEIESLKIEVNKMKVKVEQENLGKAFARGNV